VTDEKIGPIFPVRVALDRCSLPVEGHLLQVGPGMVLYVEINTGERSVMRHLTDPLQAELSESFYER
jgi:hemolysin D